MEKKGFHKDRILVVFLLLFLVTSLPIAFAAQLNQTLTYDNNGNLITGDGKYREYNEFNQLIRVYNGSNVSLTGWMEEYIWHPTEDRILIKYVNTDYGENKGADQTVVYVSEDFVRTYDLHGIIEINDTYYVRDENGIAGEIIFNGTSNNPDFDFVKRLFYHGDHIGSTSVITNSSGNLVEETFYNPYGEILEGGQVGRFTYEGREFSELTEDYDFRFRKYNPEIGVFTQPDSLIPNVYDPQSLNRYRFERNNPYKYVDPDGKAGVLVIAGAISLLVAISYGLEIYHGIRENRGILSGYEAGSIRAGQEVGGALSFESEKTLRFIAGIVLPYPSLFLDLLEVTEEVKSGRESSFAENSQVDFRTTNSKNLFNAHTNFIRSYSSFTPAYNTYQGTSYLSYEINQAQNSFSGCNRAYQSCLPQSSNNGGNSGGSSSGGGKSGGSSRGGGCGVTMSCAPAPGCGVYMSCG